VAVDLARESNASGRASVHIHGCWHFVGGDWERYCLGLIGGINDVRQCGMRDHFMGETVCDDELRIPVIRQCQVQGSVSVSVSEYVQEVEGINVRRLRPSTERLQPLNQCACGGGNVSRGSRRFGVELVTVGMDREPVSSARSAVGVLLFPHERAAQVVQRRAEIVEELANLDTDGQSGHNL
jgi:hypothetical protein